MIRKLVQITFLGVFVSVLLWIASQAYLSALERQVHYRYIADALSPSPLRTNSVAWALSDIPLDRPFLLADEELVGRAMTEAWQVLAVAQSTGFVDVLSKNFASPALGRAVTSTQDATKFGGRMAILTQNAKPLFYHIDGSIIQIEVEMIVARYVINELALSQLKISRDTGVVTLRNDSDGWRILTYELLEMATLPTSNIEWETQYLKGFNYYPAHTPWSAFWDNFDPTEVSDDFKLINQLGANSVRIFLPENDFARSANRATNLENLSTLLRIATEQNLKVIPTLFDIKSSYLPGVWSHDADYLKAVLPILSDSNSIAFIDIKNEPDLDYVTNGKGNVQAWLRTIIKLSKSIAPDIAFSIGWSSATSARELIDVVDVVSFHDYGRTEDLPTRLAALQSVAIDKPVILTEIGSSSYEIALGIPSSLQKQARNLKQRLAVLESAEGVLVWTLYDFTHIDKAAVGSSPWSHRLQSSFGILSGNGAEKPAAAVVREAFSKIP